MLVLVLELEPAASGCRGRFTLLIIPQGLFVSTSSGCYTQWSSGFLQGGSGDGGHLLMAIAGPPLVEQSRPQMEQVHLAFSNNASLKGCCCLCRLLDPSPLTFVNLPTNI